MSTATRYTGQKKGLLGYHQTTTTYPAVASCDSHADGYWGRDWQNNLITPSVTKIRHHKIPGTELNGNSNKSSRNGLQFSNLTYPNSDVVGHIFLYGDRSSERTVLYRGPLVPLYNGGDDTMEFDVNRTLKFETG
jgi:hypothetical protein